jgi:hypothetical protein
MTEQHRDSLVPDLLLTDRFTRAVVPAHSSLLTQRQCVNIVGSNIAKNQRCVRR